MENGDIFKWSYNKETLKRKRHGDNNGTTYWCVSRIGIYDSNRGLVDTFWNSSNNDVFSDKYIAENMDIEFIANINDLEKCPDDYSIYYSSDDFINLNHPNSTKGNCFLRKGAKKDIEKMKKIIKLHAEYYEKKAIYYTKEADALVKSIDDVDENSYIPNDKDIYIPDDL